MAESGYNPFKNSLSRTRKLFGRLSDSFVKQTPITDDLWDELEEALLSADVGPGTATWLMDRLHKRVAEEQMRNASQVQQALREELIKLLGKPAGLRFATKSPLTVILVIGVNGSGKTTSIAKMAYAIDHPMPSCSPISPSANAEAPTKKVKIKKMITAG